MKHAATAICLFVLGVGIGCVSSRASAASRTGRVDQLFADWNKPDSPGCGVGVTEHGAVVAERAYGMANLELGVPITPASVFSAASISKQFTAMSILLLVQRGQLALDDPVRKHITELPDYGTPLTIRHLLTHTSGLREGFGLDGWSAARQDGSDPNDAIVRVIARQRGLNFLPGAEYQYNNGGYNMLAQIVKRISGQSLRTFADANIFKPLGMTHTHLHDDPTMIVPNRVASYWQDPRGWQNGSEVPGVIGNAGLQTTVADLLRWERNFVDARVGDRRLIEAMQTSAVLTNGQKTGYGLGVSVGEYRGVRTVEHGGGDRGISTYLIRYPDQGLAIAVLCNSDVIPSGVLAQRVADIYLEDVLPLAPGKTSESAGVALPPAVSLSAEQLASYEGWYRDPATNAMLPISVRGGKLTVSDVEGDDLPFELTPVGASRFLILVGGAAMNRIDFVPATAAGPQQMRMSPLNAATAQVFARWSPKTFTAAELEAFAGDYRSDELDVTYSVAPRNPRLVFHPQGKPDFVLESIDDDVFAGSIGGIVRFQRDGGTVTGFTMTRRTVRGVKFERVRR